MSEKQKSTKHRGPKESYEVRWIEVSKASGIVHATSPEQAIRLAKRKLPDEGFEESEYGEPLIDSFECQSSIHDNATPHEDYVKFLLRTLNRNAEKRLASKIIKKNIHASMKGEEL